MSEPTALPAIPRINEDLAREAETIATGARLHEAMGMIGTYRGAVVGAQRLADIIRESGYQRDDREELQRRIAAADEYERKVRAFVAVQRQTAAKFKVPQ